jgi:hypothetical protein
MIAGNWCLYERRSSRWLFHRRRQVFGVPLLSLLVVLVLSAGAWLGYL